MSTQIAIHINDSSISAIPSSCNFPAPREFTGFFQADGVDRKKGSVAAAPSGPPPRRGHLRWRHWLS